MASINGIYSASATSSTSQSTSSSYLNDLRSRFPDLQIRVGAAATGEVPAHGSGNGNVLVDPRYLAKMQSDPETAKEGEKMLSGIPAAERQLQTRLAAQGIELLDHGTVIDKDGNMASWSYTRSSSDSRGDTSVPGLLSTTDKDKAKKKAENAKEAAEQLQEEILRRHQAKAEQQAASDTVDIVA